mgnify:CR=1 FL=1
MAKGRFIVIEGVDGCGKSTQLSMLKNIYEERGEDCRHVHFPMLNKGVYGTMVAEFLRGEYGTIEQVHPKLVALLFANDRKENIEMIRQWLADGRVVLTDRYVYSNIAYQCAKMKDTQSRKELKRWILDYEFRLNGLPKPDRTFFLDVPFSFVEKTLRENRAGDDREYLNGGKDIHEASISFQKQVYEEYKQLLHEESDIVNIPCFDESSNFLPKEEIHSKIVASLNAI